MNVLVTGGAGFIGSHTIVELLADGHKVHAVDNFSNSKEDVFDQLEKLTGQKINFSNLDVKETEKLTKLITENNIDSVIHFAAFKAVGESVDKPLLYYKNNIDGLISVLKAMQKSSAKNLIFSSSATVYGDPDEVPITEDAPLKPVSNPYGATKQMGEQIIQDTVNATDLKTVILRYFNPIGAHPSGLIGELPIGPPNNLVPYVTQAAAGIRAKLTVFGDDYDTPDGTGIRDFIHVVDLAKAHVASVNLLDQTNDKTTILNIGTGNGSSVLELINKFEEINDIKVPYEIGPRRQGDIATCYASADKALNILGWKAELSLSQALKDAWNWQKTIS